MATRRTTRSTKVQTPKLTDHFQLRRKGDSELPGKSLRDEDSSTRSAKRSLFSCSRVQVIPDVVEEEQVEIKEMKSKPVSALFGTVPRKEWRVKKEIKEESVKEEANQKVVEPVRSMIPTESEMDAPQLTRKLGTADLQSELAKKAKGAAKLHKQIAERELVKMAERETLLKSPQKMVRTLITGGSPPKRAKKEKEMKKRGPVKVLPIPDYVLPSSMEKRKEKPVREKSEERESSPQEDSLTRAPAGYGRSLMNDEVKKSASVSLPREYKDLLSLFRSCDQIASLHNGRTLTFSILSQQVEKMCGKKFSLDRFTQLLAVYPQSYNVKPKKISCVGDRMGGARSGQWEYVVKPNFDDDLTSFVNGPLLSEQLLPSEPLLTASPRKNIFSPMKGHSITSSAGIRIPASPRKPSSPAKQIQREVVMDTTKKLEGWRITCRQQAFRCLLARRVITAHEDFMDGLKLDSSVLPPSSSFLPHVFHEEFTLKMDSFCPPIEKAEIEQFPLEENVVSGYQGVTEFLKMADETVTVIPKGVEEAILELRSPEKKAFSSKGVPLSPAKFATASKPMSVLERIKARKAEEAAKAMARNPELEKKLNELEILVKKRIINLIFDIYQGCARSSMNTNLMADKLADSSGRVVKDSVPSLLDRLTSVVPSHFSLEKSSIGKFIRVMPDNSNATCTKVEVILNKEMDDCVQKKACRGI